MRLLALLVLAAAAAPGVVARAAPRQAVTVGIALGDHESAAARLVQATVTEADRIWRSRGVEVVSVAKASVPQEDVRLILEFAPLSSAPAAAKGRTRSATTGLGSIWFDEEGAPGDTITVDDQAVMARVSQTTLNNRPLADWPPAVVDHAMGRALGRVLAHELGHYLLRSKMHQTSGLMRAAFSGSDLAAWERTRFALDSSMLPRLRANLARLALLNDPAVAANRPGVAGTSDTDP